MEKNIKKNVYICKTESLYCISEIDIANQCYFSLKKMNYEGHVEVQKCVEMLLYFTIFI